MKKLNKIIFLLITVIYSCILSAKNSGEGNGLAQPSAIISGTASVDMNAVASQILFTASGGSAPYTFTYSVTGVTENQTITTTSGSSIGIPASTSNLGFFEYTLVSVADSSGTKLQSGSATVTVIAPPVVDFTFTNDNTCSDTLIRFTSNVTSTGTTTYFWDFGDGKTSTQQNPTHAYTALGCSTQNFNVTLTVTDNTGATPITKPITVVQKPDLKFTDLINPLNPEPFNNCANATNTSVFLITVGNSSLSNCISSFSIDWGDGVKEANVTFPLSHNYTSGGAFPMTITANGNNGCSNKITYIVKNLSNPIGGINSPGTTQNLCAPTTGLQFSISNWGGNSLDTKYIIDYGDGSPSVTLDQSQMNSSSFYNAANPLNSANYPIPHTYIRSSCPQPSYELKMKISNACGDTPLTLGNITILAKPEANFTNPAAACINKSVTFTNTTIAGSSQNCNSGAVYTWDFGDGSPIITTPFGSLQNINHTYLNPGTYTVILTSENFCGKSTKTQQICIETPLAPQFTLNTTAVCAPQPFLATNTTSTTNSCSPPSYLWTVTHTPNFCSTNSITIPNQTTTNASYNFTVPGVYTITLSVTNSCGTFLTSQIVTVKKPPEIASINGILSDYCGPTNIIPTAIVSSCAPASSTLTYAWSFPGGLPATSILANPGPISYVNPGPYTVSLVVTNECGLSTSSTRNFTINVAPDVTTTPLTQTVCSGFATSLVNLTSSSVGTIFNWTATATAGISGFSASGTGAIPIQTIFTTNSIPGTITYTITPTLGGCPGPLVNYITVVNPAPTITSQPSSSAVCLGGIPTVLSFTTTGIIGTQSYQWYSNTINSNFGGIAITGQTNATFAPPSTVAGTFYYYCVITLPSGGCSSITTNTATVAILPNAVITTQPTPTQNLCIGVTIPNPLSVNYTGGTGTVSFQWYFNSINATTGGTPILGATSATYTPPTFASAGSYYYYITVSLNGSNCIPATSNAAEVIVFTDPTITTQPIASQTLCQNATPLNLDITASGGNGTFSYQWYSNSVNSNVGGTLIPGQNSNNYSPPTNTVGTRYYYAVVVQNSTPGCSVISAVAAIVVIPAPTITQPVSSTICESGTPAILSIVVSGAAGTPSYQWYSNSTNTTIGGALISGATNSTFSPPNFPVGTVYYYCIVTLPSGGCSSITSNTAFVNINLGTRIDTQPTPNQTLCVGGTIPTPLTITFSGGTGTASYQWFSNSVNTNSGGTLITGATGANYTPPVFAASGTFYYYAVLTLSGDGCGSITSNVASIDVVLDPIINLQPIISQSVCQNVVPANLVVSVSGGVASGYLYQWYLNTTNNNTSGTPIIGEASSTYTPATSNVGTIYYYCVITQINGPGCAVRSNTAEVVVNLAPTISSQPKSSSVCIGQVPTLLEVSYINGGGTPTYQWYSNTVNSLIASSSIVGAVNATYSPPNSVASITYYYCIITLPVSGGCSDLTSTIASVTINPIPVISNKTALICSGDPFTILPINSGSEIVPLGTTYTWTMPNISPVGSVTGASAQNIQQPNISQNLVNTTTIPAVVTYTVTPRSGSCIGTTFTVTVTVNPAISPNDTETDSACFGSNSGAIQTNISGGIPFSSGVPYQISWTGPNGFTSVAPSISNLAPGNYALSVTDAGGCPFNKSYTITEPSDIVISTILEKDITCFNDANGAIDIAITGGTLNYKIDWTRNGTAYDTTEDINNLSPGTYQVTVSDANNCGPKTATFTITEPLILAVSLSNKTNILCFGEATGDISINVVGGTLPYTYSWTGPNNFTSSSQNLNALSAGNYNLIVTDNLGCIQNLPVQLTQTPEIVITATTTAIICYGSNDASISLDIKGGIAPYTIGWSNLGSGTFQDNLSAGDYDITVTDALNCIKTLKVNIPEAPIFTINPIVKSISCFGKMDGSIVLNFAGGKAPIQFSWDDSPTAGTTRNNLGPGKYTVTIIDSTPCTIKRTFTILEPQLLVLSDNRTDAFDCNDANSGAINLLVSGGSAPFTYSWSNGATTEDLINIPAGNYLVTVTDKNGCTEQAQYSINRPPPILITIETKTDFDCATKYVDQTFVAKVAGGKPPYQLVWSSGTISGVNNEIMNTTLNGTVVLEATDGLGCKSSKTFDVATPVLGTPSFDYSSFAFINYGSYSINDPVQFTNTSTGDFVSVLWDFGDGTFSTELNPVHIFTIPKDYKVTQTVTYPFGCVFVQEITLTVDKGYVLVVPTAFTPNSDRLNDSFRPVTKGLKNIHLDIYDTWGSLIYSEIGDVIRGWDGKIKSSNSENGNYYSKVSGETFYGTTVTENHPFVFIK